MLNHVNKQNIFKIEKVSKEFRFKEHQLYSNLNLEKSLIENALNQKLKKANTPLSISNKNIFNVINCSYIESVQKANAKKLIPDYYANTNSSTNMILDKNEDNNQRDRQKFNSNSNIKRELWTKEEDQLLLSILKQYILKSNNLPTINSNDNVFLSINPNNIDWNIIANEMNSIYNNKQRYGKQLKERYVNHLDPRVTKDYWTEKEEKILMIKQNEYGNKWNKISQYLPGRTDNAVKNYFYSKLRRLIRYLVKSMVKSNVFKEKGINENIYDLGFVYKLIKDSRIAFCNINKNKIIEIIECHKEGKLNLKQRRKNKIIFESKNVNDSHLSNQRESNYHKNNMLNNSKANLNHPVLRKFRTKRKLHFIKNERNNNDFDNKNNNFKSPGFNVNILNNDEIEKTLSKLIEKQKQNKDDHLLDSESSINQKPITCGGKVPKISLENNIDKTDNNNNLCVTLVISKKIFLNKKRAQLYHNNKQNNKESLRFSRFSFANSNNNYNNPHYEEISTNKFISQNNSDYSDLDVNTKLPIIFNFKQENYFINNNDVNHNPTFPPANKYNICSFPTKIDNLIPNNNNNSNSNNVTVISQNLQHQNLNSNSKYSANNFCKIVKHEHSPFQSSNNTPYLNMEGTLNNNYNKTNNMFIKVEPDYFLRTHQNINININNNNTNINNQAAVNLKLNQMSTPTNYDSKEISYQFRPIVSPLNQNIILANNLKLSDSINNFYIKHPELIVNNNIGYFTNTNKANSSFNNNHNDIYFNKNITNSINNPGIVTRQISSDDYNGMQNPYINNNKPVYSIDETQPSQMNNNNINNAQSFKMNIPPSRASNLSALGFSLNCNFKYSEKFGNEKNNNCKDETELDLPLNEGKNDSEEIKPLKPKPKRNFSLNLNIEDINNTDTSAVFNQNCREKNFENEGGNNFNDKTSKHSKDSPRESLKIAISPNSDFVNTNKNIFKPH